jgi:hypothetical protein
MKTLARARDRDEIVRRLRLVGPESVRRWGTMSCHQMVCHLSDAFRMSMGQMAVSPASGLLQRTVVKWIALYVSVPWPSGIRTVPEIDQALGAGTRPAAFTSDVLALEALVHAVTAEPRGFAWQPHPIFGPLSEAAWMRWGYLHMDHHLRQFGA